jgi:hypothetical protein
VSREKKVAVPAGRSNRELVREIMEGGKKDSV